LLYTYGDPDTTWSTRLSESVANDEAADANQPTYPFVWPQWDISGQPNTFMDAATWSSELSQLQSSTAGAILWSGVNDLVTSQSDSCAWIGATRQFMSSLTGDDESTGSLGVTATYPSTCLLTRGSATSVPLTVTNNGSSTSAATTLSVTTASGITASPASDTVPALAAGGTWSTTVTLTPGSAASLGDTVIGYAFSGEGAQYTTAIVEDPDLASGEPASQSSTTGSSTASLAVDGDTDPALADGSVAETTDSASPWWQVDLGSSQSIGSVAIWSSTASTVENYFLIVSSSATPTVPSAPTVPNQWVETSGGTYAMYVTRSSFRYAQYGADTGLRAPTTPTVVPAAGDGVGGRYVRVQMLGTGTLSLAEVQVRPGAPDGTQIATTDAVANGGFAADSTAGWTNYGSATSLVTSPAVAGGPYTLDEGAAASSEQTISVLPDTTYTLAGFGEVSASGNQVEVGVKDYGGSQLAAAFTSTTWSLGSVTFTTGASATSAVVFCYHDVGSGAGYCANITAVQGGSSDPANY
jgi:hypothetical protein